MQYKFSVFFYYFSSLFLFTRCLKYGPWFALTRGNNITETLFHHRKLSLSMYALPFFRVYGSIFSESKSYPCVPGDSRVVQGEKALTILKTPSVWFSKVKKNTTTADSIRRSWSDHRTSSLRTYTRLHFLINSMVVVNS